MMAYFAYNVAASLAAPFGAAWLAIQPRHRALLGRFAPLARLSTVPSRPVWVQACSVGEVNTARPIIQAMAARWPGVPVLCTTSTQAGLELAHDAGFPCPACFLPFDHPLCMRAFLRAVRPRALVLIETEIWPNLLRETRRSGAVVVLINGRLSDKHIDRYRRLRPVLAPVVRQLSAAGMQNEEYAARLIELGAPPEAVRVTGCTKFDGVATEVDADTLARLRQQSGLPETAPVLLFGSTRPGDEGLAAQCWAELRELFPDLHLVVAPRHLDRLDEALAPFREPVLRRSDVRDGKRAPNGERVFFLDTVGELGAFYGLATVAVIGGSFFPGVNGHNPLESAALGVPTVFGPLMRNFIDPARELVQAGGAVQTASSEDLLPCLKRLLSDPEERARLAAAGRRAVFANQGAIIRNLELVEAALAQRGDALP